MTIILQGQLKTPSTILLSAPNALVRNGIQGQMVSDFAKSDSDFTLNNQICRCKDLKINTIQTVKSFTSHDDLLEEYCEISFKVSKQDLIVVDANTIAIMLSSDDPQTMNLLVLPFDTSIPAIGDFVDFVFVSYDMESYRIDDEKIIYEGGTFLRYCAII